LLWARLKQLLKGWLSAAEELLMKLARPEPMAPQPLGALFHRGIA